MIAERSTYLFPNASDENPIGHLSPSQVNEFRDCAACYEANRVLHIPRVDTIHFAIGGGLHKAAEAIGRAVLAGREIAEDEVVAASEADFVERTSVPVDEESGTELIVDLAKYNDLSEAKDDTIRFTRVLYERLPKLFKERGLLAVEWNMRELPAEVVACAFPFPIEGRLDHVYGTPEGVVTGVNDLKSASKRGGPDENGVVQFTFYGLPAFMAGNPWRIGADIVIKTNVADFQTYWANGDGLITPEQYMVVRSIILDVADRICRGDFPVGKGWNGKHNYTHNLPVFSLAMSGFDAA